MKISILFEDEALVVVVKPAGIVVNRSQTTKELTVQEWAEQRLKIKDKRLNIDAESEFYSRGGIVHRLDKDTSGILLIAKTPESFTFLQDQFKQRLVVKHYISLVHGKLSGSGEIKASVGRLPWNRERFGVIAGGREANTFYEAVGQYNRGGKSYTLLDVVPHTGRTHQIRIHLKYIGHPVVADHFYAGRKTYIDDLSFCPRLFLHSLSIQFTHPQTQKIVTFVTPLPGDLTEVLKKLTKKT